MKLYMMKLTLLKEENWLISMDGNHSKTGFVSQVTYQVNIGVVVLLETGGKQMLV